MKNYNIRTEELNNACIVMVERYYKRTSSGKSWQSKPYEDNTQKITAENYNNYIESVKFFRSLGGYERVSMGYTYSGYIPVNLVSISPERTTRVERRFYIVKDEETARRVYRLDF